MAAKPKRRRLQPCDCCPPGCDCRDCEMCHAGPSYGRPPETKP